MRKGLILPVLAIGLLAGACEEDDPTGTSTTASVRFVNAVSGSGNLGFTQNGSAVSGTSLTYGTVSGTCQSLPAGTNRSIAFGTAASGGGISGSAFNTTNANLTAGGNYTLIAAGTPTSRRLIVVNNSDATGTIGTGQTAVRFVNLVPALGTSTTASNFNVFTGTATTGTPTASSIAYGNVSGYSMMTAGAQTFTFTDVTGGTQVFSGGGLNLTAGTANTVAILPNAAGTGYQLVNITRC